MDVSDRRSDITTEMPVIDVVKNPLPPEEADEPIPMPTPVAAVPDAAAEAGPDTWDTVRGPLLVSAAALLVIGVIVGLLAGSWLGSGGTDAGDNAALGHELVEAAAAPANRAAAVVELAETDIDGDGLVGDDDNCPEVSNPEQSDVDGDALGDACDLDDDGDAVDDLDDNCPLDANPSQDDVDADGLGDPCDDFPDRDADGVIDTEDPCIEEPTDVDTDGDGLVDKCDETPRGLVPVAASVSVARVTIINDVGDSSPDMFGDLTVAGQKVGLPEISDSKDVQPTDWSSGLVTIAPDDPLIRVRVWIRDESGFCLFCNDELIDLTPVAGTDALQLLVDGTSGEVQLADDDWQPLSVVGTLTGPVDGDLSGTITQQGDDTGIHQGTVTLALTVVRQPAP